MTMNHVEASLSFPNYPRFCGQLFMRGQDKELARLCVEAYNDWQVDEWCAGSNGRLIPLCLVPLWDVDLAAAEVRRNAARGVRAVGVLRAARRGSVSRASTPATGSRSSQACAETGTVLAMHIGSGTKTITSSPDAPDAVQAVNMFANSSTSLIDYLFSGVLVRHPEPEAALRRGADRVDPLRARAHRRRLGDPPRLEREPEVRVGQAVAVLLPAGHELLLQGQRRPGAPRPRRAPQHRVRDRLPAPGQHLAQHPPGRQGAVRSPRRRRPCSTSCAATPSVCSTSRVSATAPRVP